MERLDLEPVWAASAAYQQLKKHEEREEPMPPEVELKFDENAFAIDAAHAALKYRLSGLGDQEQASKALYDALLSCQDRETASSICRRAIARARGEVEPEPKVAVADIELAREETFADIVTRFQQGNGEERAQYQAKIIERYSGFAHFVARKVYSNLRKSPAVDYDDLAQEGMIALLEAADRFNVSASYTFMTYAYPNVRGRMLQYYWSNRNTVRVPANFRNQLHSVNRINAARLAQGQAMLSDEDMVELTGTKRASRNPYIIKAMADKIKLAFLISDYMGSLDTGYSPNELGPDYPYALDRRGIYTNAVTKAPARTDEELVEDDLAYKRLLDLTISLKPHLKDSQKKVLIHRFGLDGNPPLKLREVGDLLGITKERVRQLESSALATLLSNLPDSKYSEEMNDITGR